jgi:hypothetical protein
MEMVCEVRASRKEGRKEARFFSSLKADSPEFKPSIRIMLFEGVEIRIIGGVLRDIEPSPGRRQRWPTSVGHQDETGGSAGTM